VRLRGRIQRVDARSLDAFADVFALKILDRIATPQGIGYSDAVPSLRR
jgi:hypothetical protein